MTLTETAKLTKRGLIIFAVLMFLSLFSWLGYQYYYYKIYLPSIPKPEIKPDNKFGLLPKISFQTDLATSSASSSNYSYSLATQTGNLPDNLPKIVKVFFIPQLGTTLLAADKAKALASQFNFNNGPTLLTSTQYKFTDDAGGEFLIDLNSGNFKYVHTPPATDSASLQDEAIVDQNRLGETFRSFLSSKGLLPDQLTSGKIKINGVIVSMWQNDVESLPIITQKFDTGLISALTTKSADTLKKFPVLNYTYWPTDSNNFGTYYIKDPAAAFKSLQGGQGIILVEPVKPQVALTNIYLAYILTENYNPYLQPVYVFEGTNFVGIIPAIRDEFISK